MTTPGMQGEVSRESMGKTASSAVGEPAQRETGHFRTTGKTAEQNRLQPCTGKPFELANELELDSQKGNLRLICHAAKSFARTPLALRIDAYLRSEG
jgi:hypothetical protein